MGWAHEAAQARDRRNGVIEQRPKIAKARKTKERSWLVLYKHTRLEKESIVGRYETEGKANTAADVMRRRFIFYRDGLEKIEREREAHLLFQVVHTSEVK